MKPYFAWTINACTINISPLNPSDHCVVELSLGYDVYTGTKCNVQFTKGKLAWHKAKDIEIQRYMSELDALLGQCTLANEIMQCTDVNCTCEAHRLGIEVFCNTIIDACLEAGRTCIPECKPAGHSKPGWNADPNCAFCDTSMTFCTHLV